MKKNTVFSFFLIVFVGGIINLNAMSKDTFFGPTSSDVKVVDISDPAHEIEIPLLSREDSGNKFDVIITHPKTGEVLTLKMKTNDVLNFLREKSNALQVSIQNKAKVSERFIVRLWKSIKAGIRPTRILVFSAVKYTTSILFAAWILGHFFQLLADYHIPYKAIDKLVSGGVEVFVDGCSATFRAPNACVQLARSLFGPGGQLNNLNCITNPLLVYPGGPSLCPEVVVSSPAPEVVNQSAEVLGSNFEAVCDDSWLEYLSSLASSFKPF